MIGALNQRGIIMYRALAADGGGGFSESWTRLATVWLSLKLSSSGQSVCADGVEQKVRYRASLYRRSDIAAGMRLSLGSRLFDIVAVEDDGAPLMGLVCEVRP